MRSPSSRARTLSTRRRWSSARSTSSAGEGNASGRATRRSRRSRRSASRCTERLTLRTMPARKARMAPGSSGPLRAALSQVSWARSSARELSRTSPRARPSTQDCWANRALRSGVRGGDMGFAGRRCPPMPRVLHENADTEPAGPRQPFSTQSPSEDGGTYSAASSRAAPKALRSATPSSRSWAARRRPFA